MRYPSTALDQETGASNSREVTVTDTSFAGLDPRTERWLTHEQTVNERLIDTERFASIEPHRTRVRDELRPERRAVWNQEVLWLPRRAVRTYGAVSDEVRAAFGVGGDDDRMPICCTLRPRRNCGAWRTPLERHCRRAASDADDVVVQALSHRHLLDNRLLLR